MKKRRGFPNWVPLALPAALILLLTGCRTRLTFNPQELYALPELPAQYTELSSLLSGILGDGAEYAAPTSGTNIQPVQMVDLDGDGELEAVAFFRNTGDEKPLKICIFHSRNGTYHMSEMLEGSGTAIYSVVYTDLDGDGKQEIAVGWKAAAELKVLEVYSPDRNGAAPLVRTDYVKYEIADLDGDGRQGLVVLRNNEDGENVAEYYSWQEDGAMTSRTPAPISATMAELSQQGRVSRGTLRDGSGALFVTGVTDELMAVTDILTMRGSEIGNIVLSKATGISGEIAPFCSLYPADINNDGVTEVPRPLSILTPWGEESRLIEWRDYDARGTSSPVLRTFHDQDDGWFLRLPPAWGDHIFVNRTVLNGEAAVTFYIHGSSVVDSRPFLRISALTGSGREMRSVRGERFVLSRQKAETIFTAELLDANETWDHGLTEEEVRGAFSLIQREWLPNDN